VLEATLARVEPAPNRPEPAAEHGYLEVSALVKYFGEDRAVDGVSFAVPRGKMLTLLGPSGCGKTTTLMCIAGLHHFDAGEIRLGEVIYSAPAKGLFLAPEKRKIGMVFQSYAIWPHMTVAQNVAYPLEIRKIDRAEIDERVASVLRLVGLAEFSDKLATQLSGGQQQRAALARAIVFHPDLLLFDEPLSNLDLKLREQMRIEIKRIQREVGITSVYVTHDQAEALVLSDEIIVMSKGRIQQRGAPRDIYHNPVNRYVSDFIGTANLLSGRVLRLTGPGQGDVEISDGEATAVVRCVLSESFAAGAEVCVCVRPEDAKAQSTPGDGTLLQGEVTQTIFLGNCVDCRVRWGSFEWKLLAHPREQLQRGQRVYLRIEPGQARAVRPQ
jgi:iron(III) transport system ATP-binding protein